MAPTKELHIRGLVVHDEDLDELARTHDKYLRSLKIDKCRGFSTDGLMHVSKYCNQLRTFCLEYDEGIEAKDETWLHQLALNNTVLEMFQFKFMDISDAECLTLLAKNCCNSLISLKLGMGYLSKLGDAFKYAVRLEHFFGLNLDEASDLIRKLKLPNYLPDTCQCSLFMMCPNLEVLHSVDCCGDRGMQVIGKFCKKLRKFTGVVTTVGLIALAKGCPKLDCLKVWIGDNSNEAMQCLGTHLKNLHKLRMYWLKKNGTTYLPLDNGIRSMLRGCNKLEMLDMHGGLTNVGLEYIRKYGANLQSLSLTLIGNSDAGLFKLSKRCLRLRMMKLKGCPFNKQDVASFVFNMPSLRYVCSYRRGSDGGSSDGGSSDHEISVCTYLVLTRPEFQL
ncbi:leucine-rich repeat, cysteine-containing subtype protein [Tanacetum coccineum]|uniref:Leucine-rich repeat, cysteine-containing subtype protein n=1 Tax=Tanacetum coccineum TaxID=301880 RepID=A0ABQ5IGG5_9ASTR